MRVVKVSIVILLAVGVFFATSKLVRRQKYITQKKPAVGEGKQPARAPISKITVISTLPVHEGETEYLRNFAILNNDEIWATDSSGTDYLYRSLNGGKTWLPVAAPSNGHSFWGIRFLDAKLGFAVHSDGLLRTTDGGQSWKPLPVSTPVTLMIVHFATPQLGFIGGKEAFADPPYSDEVKGSLEILCTRDGGDTWRRCYREKKPSNLFQIISLSESSVFAVLDGRRLLHTTDQGQTWKETGEPNGSILSLGVAGNGSIWQVGNNGNFQYSKDDGNSWKAAHLPPDLADKQWEEIKFNGNGGGIASGDGTVMAYTCDNGDTWQQYTLSPPEESFLVPEHLSGLVMQGDLAIISGNQNHYFLRLECAATQP